MNQILNTELNQNNHFKKTNNTLKHRKKLFNLQLIFSIFFIIITLFIYYSNKTLLNKKEKVSDFLFDNYSITKLYSNNTSNNSINDNFTSSIIGIIEIPILNLSYTIYGKLDEELLKTSPCRFYGDFPNNSTASNLCIAGHNYDNGKFFSNLRKLKFDDKIFLYDNFNNKFIYSVFKNYEVSPNDLSPVYNNYSDTDELTLVTCNNFNNNRIIIKAKIEDE